MNKNIICAAVIVAAYASGAFALTGREIMDKSDALAKPETVKAEVMMLIDKAGSVAEKEFEFTAKKAGKDEKALITFTKPTKIKFLTHTHKKADDDQWLMLSSGKVKRIAAGERAQPFVNSHFYYEDMKSRDIDGYEYTLSGDGKAVGEDCYKVEAKPKDKANVYDKAVIYVRKSDFFVLRIDIFKDGAFLKYMENYDIKKVSGILTPMRSVMTMADGKSKTELKMKSVKYNEPVSDASLNKESLR